MFRHQPKISKCKNASKQSIFMQHLEKFNQNKKCIPVGCIPPACSPYFPACTAQGRSALPGGSPCQGGVLAKGGLPCQGRSALPGGVLPCHGGSALPGGGVVSQYALRQIPPPCEQNHRRLWKYNLAPTSLRAVKNGYTTPSPAIRKILNRIAFRKRLADTELLTWDSDYREPC